jgi:hypothetical protein
MRTWHKGIHVLCCGVLMLQESRAQVTSAEERLTEAEAHHTRQVGWMGRLGEGWSEKHRCVSWHPSTGYRCRSCWFQGWLPQGTAGALPEKEEAAADG